jgi:hypothetical protein
MTFERGHVWVPAVVCDNDVHHFPLVSTVPEQPRASEQTKIVTNVPVGWPEPKNDWAREWLSLAEGFPSARTGRLLSHPFSIGAGHLAPSS